MGIGACLARDRKFAFGVCFVVCFGVCFGQFPHFPPTKFKGPFRGLVRRPVRGMFRGAVLSKSNFPALLEVGHPPKKSNLLEIQWMHFYSTVS